MLDHAIELAEHKPAAVVLAAPAGRGVDARGARPRLGRRPCAHGRPTPPTASRCAATDPLYVLYTSGTTGKPKGVVRDNGGHAVALAWSMPQHLRRRRRARSFWTASDVGWVVGHSYIVYAPLLAGATTVLYEGKPVGTPDAGAFWRVIAEHGVKALFTAPTAFRAIKKEDPDARAAGRLRHLLAARRSSWPASGSTPTPTRGRPSGSACPVVDHWWQTETGWPIAANLRGLEPLEIKPGSPSVPVPGYDVAGARRRRRRRSAPATEGAIASGCRCRRARCRRCGTTTSGSCRRTSSAFDGYYLTGDGGYVDEDGYLFVMGRTDDVINVAGHRLSTGSMEAVLAAHPAVAECAVIGVADPTEGPGAARVRRAQGRGRATTRTSSPPSWSRWCATRSAPVAAFREVAVVPALPKTRSGKILRKTMREIADGKDAAVPSTIEDAGVLDTLRPVLQRDRRLTRARATPCVGAGVSRLRPGGLRTSTTGARRSRCDRASAEPRAGELGR